MTILQLKENAQQSLIDEFPKEELTNIFHLLTERYLGLKRLDVALNPSKEVTLENVRKFEVAFLRLKKAEPIQYILGETEFFGLDFKVSKDVLIPRPETEGLVRWILEEEAPATIIDLCTGSGCIAISLKSVWKECEVSALDVSKEALSVAEENAKRHTLDVNFIEKDLLKSKNLPETYDIIVSNPPYVRNKEKKQMRANVLDHEPHLALFVEDDNALVFYEKIGRLAKNHLTKNGKVYLEINEFLGAQTKHLFEELGFNEVIVKKDIFGKDRMLRATLN